MADKKQEFVYGASSLPSGERKYNVIRWVWGGLNRDDDIDTGQLSDASGVIVDPPEMATARKFRGFVSDYVSASKDLIGIFGFDDRIMAVYRESGKIKVDRFKVYRINPDHTPMLDIYTFTLGDAAGTDADLVPRSMVQFNKVIIPPGQEGNVASYTYERKILVFPDCWSIPYVDGGSTTAEKFNIPGNPVPPIQYASVYLSRVFGVGTDSVYASHYDDYTNWTLDTAENVSSDNAWMSMSQSNTDAIGDFTAIWTYNSHVVLFKKGFMQLVYNNKNPFRIVDVGAYGCDNPYAVAEMGGVLYFASHDKLYAFGGGAPKDVGKTLGLDSFHGAVLGAFRDTLYMYVKGSLYAYRQGAWSNLGAVEGQSSTHEIIQFATMDYGLCARLENEEVILIDWSEAAMEDAFGDSIATEYDRDWWFETDLMALGSLDVRRIKKFSLWCEGKEGAEIHVYLLRDHEEFDADSTEEIGSLSFDADGAKILRVLTRQFSAHAHRLRFAGNGYVKLYAAEIKLAWGGDVYVEG